MSSFTKKQRYLSQRLQALSIDVDFAVIEDESVNSKADLGR
jgi:hypothetical protein